MRAYLDHAAAARPSDAVRRAMTEACELVGSPGSVHDAGRAPAALIDAAREAVAELIGGRPEEVIFTAGATEARNLAVKGLLRANARLGAECADQRSGAPRDARRREDRHRWRGGRGAGR